MGDWYPSCASSLCVLHVVGLAEQSGSCCSLCWVLLKCPQFGKQWIRAGYNDMEHTMQVETSVQTVYEVGTQVSRCSWWGLLAYIQLHRQAMKHHFSRQTGP